MHSPARWGGRLLLLAGLLATAAIAETDKATGEAVKLGFGTDKGAALSQAAAAGRPILAFFTTDWCSWCRRLEADVLSTPEFKQGSQGWVKLVIDAEKGDGVDWAKRFNVQGYPTLILLDRKGEEIDRQAGYSPMPAFLQTFQDFERGVGTLSALQTQLATAPGDLPLALRVARKLEERGRAGEARAAFQAIVAQDPRNASGVADEADADLALAAFRVDKDAAALEAVLARWPACEQGPQLYNILVGAASKAGDEARMRDLLNRAVAQYPEDPDLLNSYAWTCAEKGWDLERALGLAEKAVRLSGGEPNILDTVAELQFKLGRAGEAAATIRQALAKRPGDEYLTKQLKRFEARP